MIEAFLELTPEERVAEAEKRLDETLKAKKAAKHICGEIINVLRSHMPKHP